MKILGFKGLLGLVILHALSVCARDTLNIGSFNVESFGKRKAMNDYILDSLAAVICKFDVIGIQEYRRQKAALQVLETVQRNCGPSYSVMINKFPTLKRAHKELYVFYYNTKVLNVVYCEQYVMKNEQSIPRPPYVCVFEHVASKFRFAYIVMHSSATLSQAVAEANLLKEVYEDVMDTTKFVFDINFGFIGGDLNIPYLPDWKDTIWFKEEQEISVYRQATVAKDNLFVDKDDTCYDTFLMDSRFSSIIDRSKTGTYVYDDDVRIEPTILSNHYPVRLTVEVALYDINWSYGRSSGKRIEKKHSGLPKLVEMVKDGFNGKRKGCESFLGKWFCWGSSRPVKLVIEKPQLFKDIEREEDLMEREQDELEKKKLEAERLKNQKQQELQQRKEERLKEQEERRKKRLEDAKIREQKKAEREAARIEREKLRELKAAQRLEKQSQGGQRRKSAAKPMEIEEDDDSDMEEDDMDDDQYSEYSEEVSS